MTRKTTLLAGAAILVMGGASLAAAFPAGQQGQGAGARPQMMQAMFFAADADGDGQVTREEFDAMGPAGAFSTADADGDGALSGDEIAAYMDAREAARKEMRQRMMLQRLDADENGSLSLEELQSGRRGPERAAMFDRLDLDGDGTVTEAEAERLQAMRAEIRDELRGQMRGEMRGDKQGRMHDGMRRGGGYHDGEHHRGEHGGRGDGDGWHRNN
ncbi:EF-hand domain-containing protein [Salipiger mucosus]|uniref:Putative signal transduction protein with EFhand domain protein n=1 Tax=Salipiger mucosus DSM 16094 TaxID=1123237 RepID=S9R0M7_9RHOB|nr:EF-hand domain-containing protein [Salipiger mucosus]EPX85437.1 putative signal transduction protein with EFhand domain protein [Salipiger mucosus DSM 16094]